MLSANTTLARSMPIPFTQEQKLFKQLSSQLHGQANDRVGITFPLSQIRLQKRLVDQETTTAVEDVPNFNDFGDDLRHRCHQCHRCQQAQFSVRRGTTHLFGYGLEPLLGHVHPRHLLASLHVRYYQSTDCTRWSLRVAVQVCSGLH